MTSLCHGAKICLVFSSWPLQGYGAAFPPILQVQLMGQNPLGSRLGASILPLTLLEGPGVVPLAGQGWESEHLVRKGV